jgi:hypothetical protein
VKLGPVRLVEGRRLGGRLVGGRLGPTSGQDEQGDEGEAEEKSGRAAVKNGHRRVGGT